MKGLEETQLQDGARDADLTNTQSLRLTDVLTARIKFLTASNVKAIL